MQAASLMLPPPRATSDQEALRCKSCMKTLCTWSLWITRIQCPLSWKGPKCIPGKGIGRNALKTPWKHPEKSWNSQKIPENTPKTPWKILKFMTFNTFSRCPLWVCPLHLPNFPKNANQPDIFLHYVFFFFLKTPLGHGPARLRVKDVFEQKTSGVAPANQTKEKVQIVL